MLTFYKEDYLNFALPLIGAEDDFYSQDKEVELLSNELLQGKLLSTKSRRRFKFVSGYFYLRILKHRNN